MLTLRTICGLLCLALLLLAAPLHAQQIVKTGAVKTLAVGESEVYTFDRMTTAAVGSPLIADIIPLSSRRLLVNAKSPGETTLFVCDRLGTHKWRLSVVSLIPDLNPVAARVQREIGLPGVTARAVKDTLFLEGNVPSIIAFQRASAIAGVYAPKVKNLLAVTPNADTSPSLAQTYAALLTPPLAGLGITVLVIDERTIALTGQYLGRLSTSGVGETTKPPAHSATASKHRPSKAAAPQDVSDDAPDPEMDLAETAGVKNPIFESLPADPLNRLIQSLPPDLKVVDMLNLTPRPTRQILVRAKIIDIDRNSSKTLGIQWGGLNVAGARGGSTYTFQPQPILFGQYGGGFSSSPVGGGPLQRILPLAAQLNALILENKARILSEPSLMVLDGSEGSILVGGEIPIPVAQASSGTGGANSSITIEYKPFGVRLSVSAALVSDNLVQMTVTPEVSELDYGDAVQISGFSIPALTVRRATSTLQMANGETLVIGGLYSNKASRQVERIPLLSQIPVLGEFFKNTITRKEESELLILIEPEIVGPETPGIHPPPPGSIDNLPIARPNVGKSDFDKDFPQVAK